MLHDQDTDLRFPHLLRYSQDPIDLDTPKDSRRSTPSFGGPVRRASELELEGQLDRARSADLVQRVEAAVCAARSQTIRKRLRRAAEQRTGKAVGGIAKVGLIQDV